MHKILDLLDSMIPILLENRMSTEKERRLASPVVDSIVESKLGRMGLEQRLGGIGDSPVIALKAFEKVASAEAAAAWVVWNSHLSCVWGKFLNEEARNTVFGGSGGIYANSMIPKGIATKCKDGYVVNGHWPLVSGSEVADWFAMRCAIATKENPKPKLGPNTELKILFIPKQQISVIDTWHVSGLRGTGSHDVKITDAFVEENMCFDFTKENEIGDTYSRLPIGCINSAGCSSIALGIAQGAINELIELSKTRVTPGAQPDLRDRERTQHTAASEQASINAARHYLHLQTERLWHAVEQSLSIEEQKELHLGVWEASCNAVEAARNATTAIHYVIGTYSLHETSLIERGHRDIHAVSQHGTVQPHWFTEIGKSRMGLEPSAPMLYT